MIRPCRYFPGEQEDRFCDECKVPCSALSLSVGAHTGHPHRALLPGLDHYAPMLWRDEAREFRDCVEHQVRRLEGLAEEETAGAAACEAEVADIDAAIAALQQRRAEAIAAAQHRSDQRRAAGQAEAVQEVGCLLHVAKYRIAHGLRYGLRDVIAGRPEHSATAAALDAVDHSVCHEAARLIAATRRMLATLGDPADSAAALDAAVAACDPNARAHGPDGEPETSGLPGTADALDLCAPRAARVGHDHGEALGRWPDDLRPERRGAAERCSAWLQRQLEEEAAVRPRPAAEDSITGAPPLRPAVADDDSLLCAAVSRKALQRCHARRDDAPEASTIHAELVATPPPSGRPTATTASASPGTSGTAEMGTGIGTLTTSSDTPPGPAADAVHASRLLDAFHAAPPGAVRSAVASALRALRATGGPAVCRVLDRAEADDSAVARALAC